VRFETLATAGCWPVDVDVAGVGCVIPAVPAVRWIVALSGQDWTQVVPRMLDPDGDGELVVDGLQDGTISYAACVEAAKAAVGAVSGLRWWTAVKLLVSGLEHPVVAGRLALHGVDAGRVGFGGWLAAVYGVLVDGADRNELTKIDRLLEQAPAGMSPAERYDPVEAAAAFERMASRR